MAFFFFRRFVNGTVAVSLLFSHGLSFFTAIRLKNIHFECVRALHVSYTFSIPLILTSDNGNDILAAACAHAYRSGGKYAVRQTSALLIRAVVNFSFSVRVTDNELTQSLDFRLADRNVCISPCDRHTRTRRSLKTSNNGRLLSFEGTRAHISVYILFLISRKCH